MENKLDLLRDLYNHKGWYLFEEYINNEIQKSLIIIKNRTTPTQEVDFARGSMAALEGLMDKVASDRQNRE